MKNKKIFSNFLLIISILILISACNKQAIENNNIDKTKKLNQDIPTKTDNESLVTESNFSGEIGEKLIITNGQVEIEENIINDGLAHFFNTEIPSSKTIYFFVVKDKNGIYRAAANGCRVCFGSRMGFRQTGNNMICNTCGNSYPIEKIATEKGGCNPGPINPNLIVKNGKIIINQSDIEKVADLF